jgi:hypothetical protein
MINCDIVGDYREELMVRMKDNTYRVYLNTAPPPAKKVTPWQDRAYQVFHAVSARRTFVKTRAEMYGEGHEPLAAGSGRYPAMGKPTGASNGAPPLRFDLHGRQVPFVTARSAPRGPTVHGIGVTLRPRGGPAVLLVQ